MKVTSITIFFALVSCISIWRILMNIKGDRIGIRSGMIWICLWLCIGLFALFPDLLDKLMVIAQMESRMFFLLVVAVFILFAVVFNLVSRIDTLQRNLSKIVQEMAIMKTRNKGGLEMSEGKTDDTATPEP